MFCFCIFAQITSRRLRFEIEMCAKKTMPVLNIENILCACDAFTVSAKF